jgi:hypothetical protein
MRPFRHRHRAAGWTSVVAAVKKTSAGVRWKAGFDRPEGRSNGAVRLHCWGDWADRPRDGARSPVCGLGGHGLPSRKQSSAWGTFGARREDFGARSQHAGRARSDARLGCRPSDRRDVAFDAADARQLVGVQHGVGHFVVISSSSVYRDALYRTLDEAPQTGFPLLPDPIPETQPTVDPGPSTYSTRKIALERHLLDESTTSVTILRSGAIYGVDSRSPREWWFAKRMLDRRPAIPLAYLGRSQFHTTAATNISALIRVAAEKPGKRVLNIADPIASSVADIAACITQHLG